MKKLKNKIKKFRHRDSNQKHRGRKSSALTPRRRSFSVIS